MGTANCSGSSAFTYQSGSLIANLCVELQAKENCCEARLRTNNFVETEISRRERSGQFAEDNRPNTMRSAYQREHFEPWEHERPSSPISFHLCQRTRTILNLKHLAQLGKIDSRRQIDSKASKCDCLKSIPENEAGCGNPKKQPCQCKTRGPMSTELPSSNSRIGMRNSITGSSQNIDGSCSRRSALDLHCAMAQFEKNCAISKDRAAENVQTMRGMGDLSKANMNYPLQYGNDEFLPSDNLLKEHVSPNFVKIIDQERMDNYLANLADMTQIPPVENTDVWTRDELRASEGLITDHLNKSSDQSSPEVEEIYQRCSSPLASSEEMEENMLDSTYSSFSSGVNVMALFEKNCVINEVDMDQDEYAIIFSTYSADRSNLIYHKYKRGEICFNEVTTPIQ